MVSAPEPRKPGTDGGVMPCFARLFLSYTAVALCIGIGPATTTFAVEANTVTRLQDAYTAVDAVWAMLPLTGEHAMFVSEKPPIFGAYKARPDNAFKQGETLLTYIEPVGYAWAPTADGLFAFGVSLDFEILTPDGKILAGQKNFLSYTAASHARVKELMLTATLNLDGFPAGSYALHYTLRDLKSPKVAEMTLPFTIAE
jgi:hypothetical protein